MKRAAVIVFLVGCVGETPEALFDSGPSLDVSPAVDGGPDFDSGPTLDGGADDVGAFDAGPMMDSGWMLDTGVDAPGTDAAVDAGPSTGEACPPAADLFCDDFDDGIAMAWSLRERNDGEVNETPEGYDGSPGVRLTLGLPNGTSALLQMNPPRWSETAFWGRYHARMERHPSNHGHLLEVSGPADGGGRAQYRLDINGGRLNSRYIHPDITEHGGLRKLGNDMPRAEWVCIEWYFDTEMNEMRYFFDGVESTDMRVDGTEDPPWNGPAADRFSIGLHHYQMDTENTEMTIDSVAIGTSRIGCQ